MLTLDLGQDVLERKDLPDAARGVRQSADGVETVDVHSGNLPRDIFAGVAKDIGIVHAQRTPVQSLTKGQVNMHDVFRRRKREIVQKGRAEIRSQIHGRAALREHRANLQKLTATGSPP